MVNSRSKRLKIAAREGSTTMSQITTDLRLARSSLSLMKKTNAVWKSIHALDAAIEQVERNAVVMSSKEIEHRQAMAQLSSQIETIAKARAAEAVEFIRQETARKMQEFEESARAAVQSELDELLSNEIKVNELIDKHINEVKGLNLALSVEKSKSETTQNQLNSMVQLNEQLIKERDENLRARIDLTNRISRANNALAGI